MNSKVLALIGIILASGAGKAYKFHCEVVAKYRAVVQKLTIISVSEFVVILFLLEYISLHK